MGRRKIQIQPITDERNRKVTFVKRKAGLFKKAHELAVLCQVDLAVIILGNNNSKYYEYSSVTIGDLLKNFNSDNYTHDVKEPKDYGDYKLISRVKGTDFTKSHQRSASSMSLSVDDPSDNDDEGSEDEDEDEDDDGVPASKRRKVKQESRQSSLRSRRSQSQPKAPLGSMMPQLVPPTQQLPPQYPTQATFNTGSNAIHRDFQQQPPQFQPAFTEVVPASKPQPRSHFSPQLHNPPTIHYNQDLPFLNQLSPVTTFVAGGNSSGLSPFDRMASTQPISSNDRARRLNSNISKRPPLRVEIPDSSNFTLPPRPNDYTRANVTGTTTNKDSAATLTAPGTSKIINNILPRPIDQTGPPSAVSSGLGEGSSTDDANKFNLTGINSPIKLTPVSATLPSALTGQFNLPPPQPSQNSTYQSTTQFTPSQNTTFSNPGNNNSNNNNSGNSGLKVSTSFTRPIQAGENTPVSVFATRIVPDVYDSPSNFFASDSWANAQFGTGNTPFPYSANPNGLSNQLPIIQNVNNNGEQPASANGGSGSGLRIATNLNGSAGLVKDDGSD